jgi:transposase-like protein
MKCPKCGSENILTRYYSFMGKECLKRKCRNCDYTWEDETEDSKPNKKW